MTETVIFGIVALIVVSIFSVAITVEFRRLLSHAFQTISEMHVRDREQIDTLLDRLMTIKWEDYLIVRETDDGEVGGFYPPEHTSEVEVDDPSGGMTRLRERMRLSAEEVTLLNEDFDEMGDPRRVGE